MFRIRTGLNTDLNPVPKCGSGSGLCHHTRSGENFYISFFISFFLINVPVERDFLISGTKHFEKLRIIFTLKKCLSLGKPNADPENGTLYVTKTPLLNTAAI